MAWRSHSQQYDSFATKASYFSLQAPLTDYWTDFESESGFGEVLYVIGYNTGRVFIHQSYPLTLQGPIHTSRPSPDNRADPIDYWIDFESESGFGKVLSLATGLVQVYIDQSYSLTSQGPIQWSKPPSQIRVHDTWTMPNTRRFLSSPNSLQIPPWRWVQSICEPLLRLEAVHLASIYCHRSTQYIVHCVGDAIHASEVRIQLL
jgi:hypothetical protein